MARKTAEIGSNLESKIIEKKKPWNPTNKRFVCFLDIMGFKDMVMRNSHDEIYGLLSELSDDRNFLENPLHNIFLQDLLKTVSFSDSIVIFTKDDSVECLTQLSLSGSWLFAKAMQKGIPLKGAISFGEMSVNITRQIFFGQPLIDAYLLQEEVAFYGIVIHNTAEKFINNYGNDIIKTRCKDSLVSFKTGKINHLTLDWVNSLDGDIFEDKSKIALNLMKNQREKTSGSPRKYIDNTIDTINQIYKT